MTLALKIEFSLASYWICYKGGKPDWGIARKLNPSKADEKFMKLLKTYYPKEGNSTADIDDVLHALADEIMPEVFPEDIRKSWKPQEKEKEEMENGGEDKFLPKPPSPQK